MALSHCASEVGIATEALCSRRTFATEALQEKQGPDETLAFATTRLRSNTRLEPHEKEQVTMAKGGGFAHGGALKKVGHVGLKKHGKARGGSLVATPSNMKAIAKKA
jgi:hypothetical protein